MKEHILERNRISVNFVELHLGTFICISITMYKNNLPYFYNFLVNDQIYNLTSVQHIIMTNGINVTIVGKVSNGEDY